MGFIRNLFNKKNGGNRRVSETQLKSLSELADEIVACEPDGDIVAYYFNESALNAYIYERARIGTDNFTFKGDEHKRNLTLQDVKSMNKFIKFIPHHNNDYVKKSTLTCVLCLGLLSRDKFCRENNLTQINTRLSADIPVFANCDGTISYAAVIPKYALDGCEIHNGALLYTIKTSSNDNEDAQQYTYVQQHKYNMAFSYNLLPREFIEQVSDFSKIHSSDFVHNDLEFVNKGGNLIWLSGPNLSNPFANTKVLVKAPVSGFLKKEKKSLIDLKQGELLCTFYINEESLLDEHFKNEVEILNDDFSRNIIIKGKTIAGMSNWYRVGRFRINFENKMGEYSLLLTFSRKAINIKRNDTFQLLFEDGTNISLNAMSSPIKCIEKPEDSIIRYELNEEYIRSLKELSVVKWQIKSNDGEILDWGNSFHQDKKYDAIFKKFIVKLENEVKNNIPESEILKYRKDKENQQNDSTSTSCFVYLMKDTTNLYYKIGISNKPEYREKTLQSEKPSIELICCKEFPSRKMARTIESALHSTYSEYQIRGEWFELSDEDVTEIIKTLS